MTTLAILLYIVLTLLVFATVLYGLTVNPPTRGGRVVVLVAAVLTGLLWPVVLVTGAVQYLRGRA